jgi:hypothetical protein
MKLIIDWYNNKYSEKEIKKIIKNNSMIAKDWDLISQYQDISENFIKEYQNKINWFLIGFNKIIKLSDEFCEEFDSKLGVPMMNETTCYFINDKLNRTLGPAVNCWGICKFPDQYWYRGQQYFGEIKKFKNWINLRIFE